MLSYVCQGNWRYLRDKIFVSTIHHSDSIECNVQQRTIKKKIVYKSEILHLLFMLKRQVPFPKLL
jgi:hypothetical protein